jgi:hypothetical protein
MRAWQAQEALAHRFGSNRERLAEFNAEVVRGCALRSIINSLLWLLGNLEHVSATHTWQFLLPALLRGHHAHQNLVFFRPEFPPIGE